MKQYYQTYIKPDAFYHRVTEIDWGRYRQLGYRLLLTDVDNTLQAHGQACFSNEAAREISRMQASGLQVAVLTNAKLSRAEKLQEQVNKSLPGLKQVKVYGLARKPGAAVLRRACAEAGIAPEESLLLGDQIFTDGLAGKRHAGAVILLDPISTAEPWYIKLKRLGERFLFACDGGKTYYDHIQPCKEIKDTRI